MTYGEKAIDPRTLCTVCGHTRNEHEMIERQWCATCAYTPSRAQEALHRFRRGTTTTGGSMSTDGEGR